MKRFFWKDFMKEIKKKKLVSDLLNVILGIIMVVLIILFVLFPGQGIILVLLFIMAGLMNIQTGLANFRKPNKRSSAMCFLVLGVIILMLGILLLKRIL